MDALYPPGPAEVPKDLTRATPAYRRQAWLATAGLLAFVALYFGLAAWFVATAWRLFAGIPSNEGILLRIGGGLGALFLATFMLKAVFFVKRGRAGDAVELTAEQQPALFAFLYQLADDAKAPRPYRVVVSARVNAAVFYDLSLANLFFRSRKNLEIGLGLVNVLGLGELKAVLAHEFGHFAQRTMAVGRWVYVTQQIAGHLVTRRDALDGVLLAMSTVDLRFAWFGWLLRLIVWSIRSLVDMAFRGVIVAQRALSREMEFQADLVAVSLTGSDALIEALHRLLGADDAWDRSLEFAEAEFKAGHPVRDLFAVQARVIERMRIVLGDATYASAPPHPATGLANYRLFKTALAAPPKMWATHPPNADRENNAKRNYVAAAVDGRPAWSLFSNPEALREQVSAHMVRGAEFKPVSLEESLTRLDAEYSHLHLDPAYRGAYLGRSATRYAERVEDLYAPPPAVPTLQALDTLYPETLAEDLERLRELHTERSMLEAVRAGFLKAPGGVIRRRGEEIALRDLPLVMDTVQREFKTVNATVQDHDRRCRSIHRAAAQQLGDDWAAYLKGILGVLHYADHAMADLMDAHGLLSNTLAIVTADGRVSGSEMGRLLQAAQEAYAALRRVHDRAAQVLLDPALAEKLGAASWAGSLEELKLLEPIQANLGPWLNAVSGWTQAAAVRLNALQLAALEQLLATERQVAQCVRDSVDPGPAPGPSVVPANYQILLPGQERERQAKLGWWDRFQLAEGWIPAVARAAAAVAIVGAVLLAGSYKGDGTIAVYNGLGRPVRVEIDKPLVIVGPNGYRALSIAQRKRYHIRTRTIEGILVEEFDAPTVHGMTTHVYNVAGAGALVAWTATDKDAAPRPAYLQNARWSPTRADMFFPTSSEFSSRNRRTRTVLTGLSGESPQYVLSVIDSGSVRSAVIGAHARWDLTDTKWLAAWLRMAAGFPNSMTLSVSGSTRPRTTLSFFAPSRTWQ